MKKIKALLGLKVVEFGIKILESMPFGFLDDHDKSDLKRLWDYHDKFTEILKS